MISGSRVEIALSSAHLQTCQNALIFHQKTPILRVIGPDGKEVELPEGTTLVVVNSTILESRKRDENSSP